MNVVLSKDRHTYHVIDGTKSSCALVTRIDPKRVVTMAEAEKAGANCCRRCDGSAPMTRPTPFRKGLRWSG